MSKKEKEVVEDKVESEAVKKFRATWELYKTQNPEKYAEKIKNGEFDTQLDALEKQEKEKVAEEARRLASRTTLSELPKV